MLHVKSSCLGLDWPAWAPTALPTWPLSTPTLTLQAVDRRERLRRLALETIDLSKDPYFMRNHLGQYECRLCLTLHTNEGNYLAHTQGGCRGGGWKLSCPGLCSGKACCLQSGLLMIKADGNRLPLLRCAAAGKRHQQNLAKRAAREAAEKPVAPAPQRRVAVKKTVSAAGYLNVRRPFNSLAGNPAVANI